MADRAVFKTYAEDRLSSWESASRLVLLRPRSALDPDPKHPSDHVHVAPPEDASEASSELWAKMEQPPAQKRSLATKGQSWEWLHLFSRHMLIVLSMFTSTMLHLPGSQMIHNKRWEMSFCVRKDQSTD